MVDFENVKRFIGEIYDAGIEKSIRAAEDISAYLGVIHHNPGRWILALRGIVDKHTTAIFKDRSKLAALLANEGVDETVCLKILLMTRVPGLDKVINGDESTRQADLDRYISNAVKLTAFNRGEVLKLTGDICYAVGIDMFFKNRIYESDGDAAEKNHSKMIIPRAAYEKELNDAVLSIKRGFTGKLDAQDVDRLIQLARLGFPSADSMYGQYLIDRLENGELFSSPKEAGSRAKQFNIALKHLKRAANAGDAEAAARLGDFFFTQKWPDSWNKAYDYYTGYGALALTSNRKAKLLTIMKQKQINKKILIASVVLFILMAVSVFSMPFVGISAAAGLIVLFLSAGILVIVFLHNRIASYGRLYFMPAVMIVLWFVYLITRMFF